jgi:hypothetical protein
MAADPVQAVRAAAKRARKRQDDESQKAQNLPIQLPLWSESRRGLPNTLARCALFTAQGKFEPRENCRQKPIVSVEGTRIAYTGEELRQDDQDVFLQLVHMARGEDLGKTLVITGYSVLTELGWGSGGLSYQRLKDSVMRLRAGLVIVARPLKDDPSRMAESEGFTGNLIKVFDWHGETWNLALDPRLVKLFGERDHTWVGWEQRKKLNPLAKWLHSFYSTHDEPFSYSVQRLRELCGSKVAELKHFRAKLKKALDELVKHDFLLNWGIDESDKVVVKRKGVTPALLV